VGRRSRRYSDGCAEYLLAVGEQGDWIGVAGLRRVAAGVVRLRWGVRGAAVGGEHLGHFIGEGGDAVQRVRVLWAVIGLGVGLPPFGPEAKGEVGGTSGWDAAGAGQFFALRALRWVLRAVVVVGLAVPNAEEHTAPPTWTWT